MKLKTLPRQQKTIVEAAFNCVKKVDFSVESYLDSNMGIMYVDDTVEPQAFMLQNGVFRIFTGPPSQEFLYEMSKSLSTFSIVLPSANGWFDHICKSKFFSSQQVIRYNMNPDQLDVKYLNSIKSAPDIEVKRMTLADAKQLNQSSEYRYHLQNFENEQDFLLRGLGYVAIHNDIIVGAATSALVCKRGIEVNIMVSPTHRNRGVALSLGAGLVGEALINDLNVNWDAGNEASMQLATKLGFTLNYKYEAIRVTKVG